MVTTEQKEMTLYDFAYCGSREGFQNMINYLANIAEPETWSFSDNTKSVLIKYIKGTFKQCYKQNKILYTSDKQFCCINTGLLTPNGNDIMMIFEKNTTPDKEPWVLKAFRDYTERQYMDLFKYTPEMATYTDNYELFYFNPNFPIIVSSDHILDDNWERIQSVAPSLSKTVAKTLMVGVIEETKRKIKRNLRLVVPQYYKEQIMYLMPVRIPINDDFFVTMALAVELTASNQYRANTIFTKEMAYEKARLLMKPESNWLVDDK